MNGRRARLSEAHARIDRALRDELRSPLPDAAMTARLKKLWVKNLMARRGRRPARI